MKNITSITFLVCLASALILIIQGCKQNGMNQDAASHADEQYTCSMHPEIIRNEPGTCPVCGMRLEKKSVTTPQDVKELKGVLNSGQEQPSSVELTVIQNKTIEVPIFALGAIENDSRQTGVISARVSGRIEKLYIRYRYQMIEPGQKIMDIYSPELATAQQNLLFLLGSDADNYSLINSAKQRLLLLGMSNKQLDQLVKTRKASPTITVFSSIMGHVHEAGQETMGAQGEMQPGSASATSPLTIREGMYVTAGQRVFSITDPNTARATLQVFPEHQHLVKVGSKVKITPEVMPDKSFIATIKLIEPFYRSGNKTLTVQAPFDNSDLQIPIGSQVKAEIVNSPTQGNWLPLEAVVSLGIRQVVFVKTNDRFRAHQIQTGIIGDNMIQVLSGLAPTDSVALNAQYLTDSEGLIKIDQ